MPNLKKKDEFCHSISINYWILSSLPKRLKICGDGNLTRLLYNTLSILKGKLGICPILPWRENDLGTLSPISTRRNLQLLSLEDTVYFLTGFECCRGHLITWWSLSFLIEGLYYYAVVAVLCQVCHNIFLHFSTQYINRGCIVWNTTPSSWCVGNTALAPEINLQQQRSRAKTM